jgi:hypothetical protein
LVYFPVLVCCTKKYLATLERNRPLMSAAKSCYFFTFRRTVKTLPQIYLPSVGWWKPASNLFTYLPSDQVASLFVRASSCCARTCCRTRTEGCPPCSASETRPPGVNVINLLKCIWIKIANILAIFYGKATLRIYKKLWTNSDYIISENLSRCMQKSKIDIIKLTPRGRL